RRSGQPRGLATACSGKSSPGGASRIHERQHLVARLINMAAFGRRCIPPGCVARRSNVPDILATRALPGGRLAALGASPYLCDGPLSSRFDGDSVTPNYDEGALTEAVNTTTIAIAMMGRFLNV